MMSSMNEISITPVANGFLVTLPLLEMDPTDKMIGQFGKLAKKINKDEVLAAIEEEQEQIEQSEKSLVLNPLPNVFIFSRFKDVLAFLTEKFANV